MHGQQRIKLPATNLICNYRDSIIFPYVFVADEGFAMKPNILRLYCRNNAFD